jgi:hypothetical protein
VIADASGTAVSPPGASPTTAGATARPTLPVADGGRARAAHWKAASQATHRSTSATVTEVPWAHAADAADGHQPGRGYRGAVLPS